METILTTVNNISVYGFKYQGSNILLATYGYLDYDDARPAPNLPARFDESPLTDINIEEIESLVFWNYISTFWNYLTEKDRDIFENFWDGLTKASYSLYDKAKRFFDLTNPENTNINIAEYYYDILIGPLNSIPTNLDPTSKNPNYIIRPIDKILIEPEYDSNENPIYNDLIEIERNDYYKIRDIGIGQYIIIKLNDENINNKYFKIIDLLSSEEIDSRYYPASSKIIVNDELIDAKPYFKYIIKIDGDLSYIKDNTFTIYLTTGLSYQIDNYITELPVLKSFISKQYGITFYENVDYLFYNHTVEFINDIFSNGNLEFDTYLYCPNSKSIEYMLYETYGTLVDLSDWESYGHDIISGKAAINSLLLSIQNSNTLSYYNRALNIYYGMPVAPEDATVVGLYESYAYEVLSKSESYITIKLKSGSSMHPFIQNGTILLVEGKSEIMIYSVINRLTGELRLYENSNVDIGDFVYVKLNNKYGINGFRKEVGELPGSIDIITEYDADKIQHIINIIQYLTDNKQYPEILVYGTELLEYNYNGIYHITNAEKTFYDTKLTIYHNLNNDNIIYNDFIVKGDSRLHGGFVHIPWPTHKFLYLYLKSKKYYKVYIDAPIDTIYDTGDEIKKYDVLTRNVSAVDNEMFKNWVEFDQFRRYNGLNIESNHIELTSTMPIVNFGEYFPESVLLK
jgi:hypothetical protein